MDKENKLFLVDVKRHDFYVVAKSIEVLAVEHYFPEGKQTFCGEKSNLVIGELN